MLRRIELFFFQGKVSEFVELPTAAVAMCEQAVLKGIASVGSELCLWQEFNFGTIFTGVLLFLFFQLLAF